MHSAHFHMLFQLELTMNSSNRLYFIIGALAVIAVGLAVYIYRQETEPKGVELNIGRDGITIQEK
ncbi:MAG TPA: hypothetical protein DIC56_19230 [Rhizobium sp.]|nr:hypothetical protein [Rhizobium sp.]